MSKNKIYLKDNDEVKWADPEYLYFNATEAFKKLMIDQLRANSKKGDRENWLKIQPLKHVIDIYYHAAKLQEAVRIQNHDKIKEYAADVANIALMVADRCGDLLGLPDNLEPIEKPTINWNIENQNQNAK